MAYPKKPPTRRNLKATILWCARWMLGDGEFYKGRVQVEICAAGEGETLKVVPTKEVNGLADPGPLMATGGTEATPSELLRVLLSDDEKKILRVLLATPNAKAKVVQERCAVESSRFYPLWTNLQFRGFVADADAGEGYMLAVPWVRELLEMGTTTRPAA